MNRLKEEDILIWIGVVAQLTRTRANRLLADSKLPFPLFVLLQHFAHDPQRKWSVTQLTRAFETGQPGMTKKVQKLLALELLNQSADDKDARIKWFSINAAGLHMLESLGEVLRDDIREAFSVWSDVETSQAHELLSRLKSHLDENR